MKEFGKEHRIENRSAAQNWNAELKDRPTFKQLEEIISGNMESSVCSYFSNLNAPDMKNST